MKKRNPKIKITIDESLNKYKNVVLFPEKLAKANEMLSKAPPPKFKENKISKKRKTTSSSFATRMFA